MRILAILAALAATTPVFAQDATAELKAVNDAFNAGIASQDVQGLVALYGPEVMWIAPGSPMNLNGLEEAENLFTFMTGQNAEVTHDIDHLFVSDDETLAVMIGDVTAKVETLGIDGVGTYLYVLENAEGDWKIIADMWNQVPQD
ncbi:YybH family protein [Phaeobacter gallaeciensis]|uniref:SnoaL-like domain protein n=1 Tax=Phaeobacter gallaeciensis TaxID=60890 RepID=A0AAC9Z7C4_9RHOB|nr:DUF4440 domain-containing protein [Phaeobacter gallaeciensis]AHD08862.1 SnoaL-like domain protein [Phaeobacter gallaeciensis DSM 26640]ATE92128.1 SnoaL-like domain protein [Phaeobacter gallaeciensis]ATE98053.1 SnoaL-like domain protein [Phaeobacter gallaeciensis]ATF00739.1 SnoaL-like domain protein [Phaeobacter gallaeciensis]ATF05170.1 SnoaL-like domain protein [Phaeobacter gallaeciensis]